MSKLLASFVIISAWFRIYKASTTLVKTVLNPFALLCLFSLGAFAQSLDLSVDITNPTSTTPVSPGSYLTVNYKVYNDGDASTTGYIFVGFYLSTNSTFETTDTYISNDSDIAGISASSNASGSASVYISSSASGYKYIFAYVNYSKGLSESDYNNNISTAYSIYVGTPDVTPPAIPKNLTATPGVQSATLNWAANTESDFASYQLYRNTTNSSSSASLIQTITKGTTQYINTGLTGGTTYYYWLKAKDNSSNVSGFSSVASATLLVDLPPATPTGFMATAGVLKVTLNWSSNAESDFASYQLYRNTSDVSSSATLIQTLGKAITQYDNVGLTSGASYYYWLKSVDNGGNVSDFSEVVSAVPIADTVPPVAPKGFVATAGILKTTLNWTANTEPDLASYSLYRSTRNDSTTAVFDKLLSKPQITTEDINLLADTTYYYWLVAVDASNNVSGFSSVAFAKVLPPDIIAPAAPTGLQATVGAFKIILSWNANAEPDLGSYLLYRNTQDLSSGAILVKTVDKTTTTTEDVGLLGNTTYYYWLVAVDNATNKSTFSVSTSAQIVTLDANDIVISGGNSVSSMLCASKKVYAWGLNASALGAGILGIGSAAGLVTSPTLVTFPNDIEIQQVNSGSGSHFLALDCQGGVFAWGGNYFGQVGNGSSLNDVTAPVRVKAGVLAGNASWDDGSGNIVKGVREVYAGNNNSFAILNDGRLISWGGNEAGASSPYDDAYGQLGDGTYTSKLTPVFVLSGNTGDGQTEKQPLIGVKQVFSGDNVAYALVDVDGDGVGTVYSWGNGLNGTLGRDWSGFLNPVTARTVMDPYARPVLYEDDSEMDNIKSISAGDVFGMALDKDGYIWTWGNGGWNNATGSTTTQYSGSDPEKVLAGNTTGGSNDGTYLLASKIAGGQGYGIAITIDGKPVAWGGQGLVPDGSNPVCGLGGLTGTGYTTNAIPPSYIRRAGNIIDNDVVAIRRGDTWGYYLRADGSIYAWGCNIYGQLGIGNTANQTIAVPFSYPTGCEIKSLTCAPTGIQEEVLTNQSLLVYPNPSNGSFTVQSSIEGTYSLINEMGQEMREVKLNAANSYTKTVDNLPNGLYLLKNNTSRQVVHQKVLVTGGR